MLKIRRGVSKPLTGSAYTTEQGRCSFFFLSPNEVSSIVVPNMWPIEMLGLELHRLPLKSNKVLSFWRYCHFAKPKMFFFYFTKRVNTVDVMTSLGNADLHFAFKNKLNNSKSTIRTIRNTEYTHTFPFFPSKHQNRKNIYMAWSRGQIYCGAKKKKLKVLNIYSTGPQKDGE